MSLVAIGDGYEYNSKIKFWENVRGEQFIIIVTRAGFKQIII